MHAIICSINTLTVHEQQLCLLSWKFVNVHECPCMFEIIFKTIRILNQSEINEPESSRIWSFYPYNVHERSWITKRKENRAILLSNDHDSWVNFNKQGSSLFLNVLIQEGKMKFMRFMKDVHFSESSHEVIYVLFSLLVKRLNKRLTFAQTNR